jgi:hypothetical protein
MVLGMSERDARAAELRRRDLLAAAARERRAGASGAGERAVGTAAPRWWAGAALVRAGGWLQGAPRLGPAAAGGPVAALGAAGEAPLR